MDSANRVARNTGFLYGKMLITIIISLYSARLILNALGEIDYGVFNLVGGVIAMLSFLNSAMSISTQRYLSYFMGAGDKNKMKSLFSSSVLLHLLIGIVVILLLEFAGVFLFDGLLNIPLERIKSAKIVYHLMVVSAFFTINAVPYYAAINAHENMLFDAITGVLESLLKLGIAIWLIFSENDKLILYGLLIAGLTILIRIIMGIYCFRKYEECHIRFASNINIRLLKELFSFAGWNLFGSFCSIVRNQGLAIVLNLFFGVLINAAYGIANQVNGQLSAFSTNMMRALNPQIVKSEGNNDRERMLRLSILGCKMAFLLFAFIAVPLIIEMPYVLKIWLKIVPENTVIFCRLVLVLSLVQQLTVGLMTAVTAVGKIKVYQMLMGLLLLLNLPLAIGLIKLGFPAYSVLVGSIIIEFITLASRIWLTYTIAGLNVKYFLTNVIMNSTLSITIVILLAMIPHFFIEESLLRAGLSGLISLVFMLILARLLVFNSDENRRIKELILNVIKKFKRLS